ncbi:unnamed protein product [Cylindrotheca closterium]|uniref:Uncharacterized protein n=1 Tax=Cylindrotheca closterium TaxID=2856 RepID=A0AAD2FYD1_9STRA|nr:unnamed protein product [Cylindrotheca closterium]
MHTPKNQMKMYKANSLATFLKDDMRFSWEDNLFDSDEDEEETVVMSKTRTSIRFSDNVDTQEIPCISDMETSEVADVWYTHHDFATMKAECRQLAKSFVSGRIQLSADICLRGLEEKLHRNQKKINRSEAIGAVLDEQDAQFGHGEQNHEVIAHVYHEFAAHCLDEAVDLALRDQETAFKIHGITSSPSSSSCEDNRCTSKISGISSLGSPALVAA